MTDVVDEIKRKVDIVEIVSKYIKLKRSGSSYKGLCPFHQEKTPSFFVSPERQFFKCFGCGESGDVISFLMKIEGWSFYEALKYLSKISGVRLEHIQLDGESQLKEKLYRLNRLAAEFYHYILLKMKLGKRGRDYLEERLIGPKIVRRFYLGFAPSGWQGLTNFLRKKGWNLTLAEKAGLVIKNNQGRYYDRFRDRLIFPLFNITGEVVGFGGRRLIEDPQTPKYINTPETPLYNKSRHLFGLYQAKEFIRRQRQVIVTEGEFDVLSSYQAGVKNIVAVKGSALTIDHLKILKRYADEVLFAFDSDSAGFKASQRSFILAENIGLKNKTISLSQGKDIDELVKTSPEKWQKIIPRAIYTFDYLLDHYWLGVKEGDPYSKNDALLKILEVVNQLNNPVIQEEYLARIADKFMIGLNSLNKLWSDVSSHSAQTTSSAAMLEKSKKENTNQDFKLEAIVLALLLRLDKREKYLGEVKEIFFHHHGYRRIFSLLKKSNTTKMELEEQLEPELMPIYNELFLLPEADKILEYSPPKKEKEIRKIFNHFKKEFIRQQINNLKNVIQRKENEGQPVDEERQKLSQYLHLLGSL